MKLEGNGRLRNATSPLHRRPGRRWYAVLVFCMAQVLTAGAQANTSARIEGVAQFLIERAQENYLYIFEQKLRENRALQCYFGETLGNLKIAGLKELLLSRELWERSLEKDLDTLLTRAAARSIESSLNVSSLAVSLWGEYIEFLGKLEIQYKGDWRPMNWTPVPRDLEFEQLLNPFYETPNAINDALRYFQMFDKSKLCETPVIGHREFLVNIDAVYRLDDMLREIRDNFRQHRNEIRFADNPGEDVARGTARMLDGLEQEFGKQTKDYRAEIKTLIELTELYRDDNTTATVKAIETLNQVQQYSGLTDLEFEKLRRQVLFFAQIGSAEDPNEVAAILNAYTVPAVSFFEKRKPDGHWLINAYLGLAAGNSDLPDSVEENNDFGIYAPIGLEYAHGLDRGGSLAFMVAPFDFGYPVNLKLNGIESDYATEEIIAPSFAISYGFDDIPLAIGLVYQIGKSFPGDDDEEKRLFLHFSFDMPLWNL